MYVRVAAYRKHGFNGKKSRKWIESWAIRVQR